MVLAASTGVGRTWALAGCARGARRSSGGVTGAGKESADAIRRIIWSVGSVATNQSFVGRWHFSLFPQPFIQTDPGYQSTLADFVAWGVPTNNITEITDLRIAVFGINNFGWLGY